MRAQARQKRAKRDMTGDAFAPMDSDESHLQGSFTVATLPDGTYDVIVVDVEATDDGDIRLELTVTLGPHVGRLVTLRGRNVQGAQPSKQDPVEWLGIPGALQVKGADIRFRPERP